MGKKIKIIFSLLVVLGLIGAGAAFWLRYASNTPDFEGERGIKIAQGTSFEGVADSLQSAGLLKNRVAFEVMGYATGWARQMKPGYYAFESGTSTYDLLDRIRKGLQTPVRVTIPPGTRPGVVAAVLRRDLDVDSTAFRAALRNPKVLEELKTDSLHLFGYMLPETYQIYWGSSAEAVVKRLKREFERFFTDEMRQQAADQNLTIPEVIRLASIVQWEARIEEEKPRVAGVYLNRLRIGMPLQADPTVQYALMQMDGGRMRRLLFRDYEVNHPYNTYRYGGLPPGPINNPDPASIRAVLKPEPHSYLYFVADGSGRHRFSRTLAEHNRAAADYRRLMRQRRREQAAQGG